MSTGAGDRSVAARVTVDPDGNGERRLPAGTLRRYKRCPPNGNGCSSSPADVPELEVAGPTGWYRELHSAGLRISNSSRFR